MLILLTGWPACGQAFYGEHLVGSHDFRHLDLESDAPEASELQDVWHRHVPEKIGSLVDRLSQRHPRWVVTGAAPAEHLPHLGALQAAGFQLWFLQPRSDNLSRQSWLRIERELDEKLTRPSGWEKQADAIRQHARQLRPYFRDRCVTTLRGIGELMPAEEFSTQIGLPAARPEHT